MEVFKLRIFVLQKYDRKHFYFELFFKRNEYTRDGQSGPGPTGTGTKVCFLTGTKFFLPRTSTEVFSEEDRERDQKRLVPLMS